MRKTLKIAHLSSAHPDKDVRIFYKECVSLANNFHPEGIEVDVHLVLAGVEERQELQVQVHSVEKVKGRFSRMLGTVNRVYQKAIELDADIYHLHDPELLRIALKLKRKGKKVIYDAHEDLPKQIMDKHWIPFFLRKVVSSIVGRIEHYITKRIHAVISVNEPICERFRKSNSRVSMVANYPLNTEAEALKDISEQRKPDQICYIGGLFPTRGIKELVVALENVNATLVLAGTFSPENFEDEVKALPGWKKVDFRGFIDRKEILKILKTSVLGVVTLHPTKSYVESLPIKMFEYMSAGMPVLASDFPMWKDIIEKEGCGRCVDPLDPDSIADGIRFFMEQPVVAEEMGEKGAKAFEERYNWKAEEKKLFSLYEQLITRS